MKKVFGVMGEGMLIVFLFAFAVPAHAGLLRLGYHYGVKPAAHHVKHCGPKVLKGAGKVALKVIY